MFRTEIVVRKMLSKESADEGGAEKLSEKDYEERVENGDPGPVFDGCESP